MGGSAYETTCPVCGKVFSPPSKAAQFFCPQCGMQMASKPAELTSEEAQAQAMRAVEQAARAAEQATLAAKLAAQGDQNIQSVDDANKAVQQAMEAMRMAQEAQRAQEQLAAEQARQIAQANAELERQRVQMEEEHRRQNEEAKRQAEELERRHAQERAQLKAQEERRVAEARRQEEERRRAAQQAAAKAARPRQAEYRRNVTVRHTDGRGMYVVTIPTNWVISDTVIQEQRTRPFNPRVTFKDNEGALIILQQGAAGTRLSSGMKAVMGMYGSAIAGVDRTNYAEMPNPVNLADSQITAQAKASGATDLRLVADIASQQLAERQQHALQVFKNAGANVGNTLIKDPFAAEVLRIYEYKYNGMTMKTAVYVRLYATKDASGVENLNPMGLMFNAGSALGGLFKKNKQPARQPQQTSAQGGASSWCVPNFDSYVSSGTIYWDVCGLATLTAPASTFEESLNTAFLPLVRSYDAHPDMIALANARARQEAAQVQQATNRQINMMNMQTQASLAAARQMSAASSAQTEAYLRNSDAHHRAFRERTNAQFNSGYGGSSAPDFSEAIRGVNTFVTSDGREVELDVSADRAYENQAGDVIGGSGGFDPGADWTEIPRA